jgi:hypothetical protein
VKAGNGRTGPAPFKEVSMKKRLSLIMLAVFLLMPSCAIFIYEDEPSSQNDDDDTLTIIFHEPKSLVGP